MTREPWLIVSLRRPNRLRQLLCGLLGHSYPVAAASPETGPVVVCVRCRAVMLRSLPWEGGEAGH